MNSEFTDTIATSADINADDKETTQLNASAVRRTTVFAYGLICYAIFFGTTVYGMGFFGNIGVPKSIDSGRVGPLAISIVINMALLAVFALQHSVMARPAFKEWWTRFVPSEVERSTYVLFTCVALVLLYSQWRPLGGVVWDLSSSPTQFVMWGLYACGWALVFTSTFLINHFDLFGLRQVWLYFRNRPYTYLKFATPGPYKWIRHPLYVGWFMVFWFTPTMTITRLVFAIATTAYILIAIQLEERDLVSYHGYDYVSYRRRVPMLIPRFFRRSSGTGEEAVFDRLRSDANRGISSAQSSTC